jgi:hypothetical protein
VLEDGLAVKDLGLTKKLPATLDALDGGGEMGGLVRTHPWIETDLGPIEAWPHSLRTALSLILNSQHPMWIGWGQKRTFLYNDAYIQILGPSKHPWALGRPFSEVWAEILDVCGPLADKVFEKGEATFVDNVRLFMRKPRADGTIYLKEEYYSFSYSPIRDESGSVGGLFCPSTSITDKILGERRLRTISELSASALIEKTLESTCASVAETLRNNPADIPFAQLYLSDPTNRTALLQNSIGLEDSQKEIWPVSEVIRTGRTTVVSVRADVPLTLGLAEQKI